MKLTESQLRRIIREELTNSSVKKVIKESSSKSDYLRFKELRTRAEDFYYLKKISSQHYDDIRKLKDKHKHSGDYSSFFWDMQQYGLQASLVKAIFEGHRFVLPADETTNLMKEYDVLNQRFVSKNVTDETDRAYGRKRFQITDKETNEIVDEFTDRKGSLGS
jgi:hypothetical protein